MLSKKDIKRFKKIDPEILKRLPKWQQKLHKIILEVEESKNKK
jgi:hypothetical protein